MTKISQIVFDFLPKPPEPGERPWTARYKSFLRNYVAKEYIIGMEQGLDGGVPGCVQTPARVRVPEERMGGRLLGWAPPIYPREAQAQRIEGTVAIGIVIDFDGSVLYEQPLSGPSQLVPAAVDAVKKWKYQAFVLGDGTVQVDTIVHVAFALPHPE